MGNLSSAVSAQVRTVRRGPQTPQWWVLLQVGLGVALFGGIAWAAMSGHQTGGVVVAVDSPAVTDTAPTGDPSTDPTPGTTEPGDSSDALVSVRSTDGVDVNLPRAAVDAATLAFAGTVDAEAAAKVPMRTGEAYPVPTQTMPDAVVGTPSVAMHTTDRITFVATVDTDGAGSAQPTYVPWTVVRDGGTWVVTAQE